MDNPLFSNFDGRKILANVGHWQPLADGVIPSPIANSLDLSSAQLCPNKCYFCDVRWSIQGEGGHMIDETLWQVLDVYKRQKVRSACIAGGGESLANPRSEDYLRAIVAAGTDIGIITNGRFYRKLPPECRFVNVSVNAADKYTYRKMCGVSKVVFDEVCEHIQQWVADGQRVTYKVMITDRNKSAFLLSSAVEKAAELGVAGVLFRFAMVPWDRVGNEGEFIDLGDMEADLYEAHAEVLKRHYPQLQIEIPMERYDRWSRKFIPKRCTGGAVNFVTLWNGDCYVCSSQRSNPGMRLCHISEFDEQWGGQRHKDLLAAIDPSKCGRCPFFLHDRIVEEFVYNDQSNQFFI